jgi:hypothetical protein
MLGFDNHTVFWAPEVLPSVLRVLPVAESSRPLLFPFDFEQPADAARRLAPDGWHVVFRLAGYTHRLVLSELPERGAAFAVELPLDRDFDLKARAAHRLWTGLRRVSSQGGLATALGPGSRRLRGGRYADPPAGAFSALAPLRRDRSLFASWRGGE